MTPLKVSAGGNRQGDSPNPTNPVSVVTSTKTDVVPRERPRRHGYNFRKGTETMVVFRAAIFMQSDFDGLGGYCHRVRVTGCLLALRRVCGRRVAVPFVPGCSV